MKYMISMNYGPIEGVPPITQWDPADVSRHMQFQHQFGQELRDAGEFVGGEGLAGPGQAKVVRFDGTRTPAVSDGPFPETKELLAGYWLVDVEREERALEIAAKASAAPGPGGRPLGQHMQVQALLTAPPTTDS